VSSSLAKVSPFYHQNSLFRVLYHFWSNSEKNETSYKQQMVMHYMLRSQCALQMKSAANSAVRKLASGHYQAILNTKDAIDRSKWRKLIKDVWWSGWVWVGECFFLVPAYPGSPRPKAVKRMCVCVCHYQDTTSTIHTNTHTHTCLTALCPRQPGWAGTRKVKPIWFHWSKRQWVAYEMQL